MSEDLSTSNRAIQLIANKMAKEAIHAILQFPPFHSAHEGKAVIEEELEELWEEVKKYPNFSHKKMEEEAIQLGAMAIRFILEVCITVDNPMRWIEEEDERTDQDKQN